MCACGRMRMPSLMGEGKKEGEGFRGTGLNTVAVLSGGKERKDRVQVKLTRTDLCNKPNLIPTAL